MPPPLRGHDKASKKSVRFNPAVALRVNNDGDDAGTAAARVANAKRPSGAIAVPPSLLKKRRLNERPNEDELDDVDDWVPDEEDEEEVDPSLPSERERLQAKRARRQKRQHGGNLDGDDMDDDDDEEEEEEDRERTLDDTSRSLATEGITVEPFNMQSETNDGSGYFDGDTYVFRRNKDADEEPDAWLDSLSEDNKNNNIQTEGDQNDHTASESSDVESQDKKKSPELTKEEWYAKIVPLMGDKETIMQAVVRYGSLLKRTPLHNPQSKNAKKNPKSNHTSKSSDKSESQTKSTSDNEQAQTAQKSLNDLTEASSALLNMGEVDIYQKTRQDLLHLVPAATTAAQATATSTSQSTVHWEYKGNRDGQIHGPYTSEQMKAWIQAGYFVGAQAVQVRSVTSRIKPKSKEEDVKDLLSDLMDDDDDEGEEDGDDNGNTKDGKDSSEQEQEIVRGEWVSSETANY